MITHPGIGGTLVATKDRDLMNVLGIPTNGKLVESGALPETIASGAQKARATIAEDTINRL